MSSPCKWWRWIWICNIKPYFRNLPNRHRVSWSKTRSSSELRQSFVFQCNAIVEVIQHFQFCGLSDSCWYEQCSVDFCVVSICQFWGIVLCRPRVLIWSVCLWPWNYEKIKKWQRSTWRRTAIYCLQMQKLQRNLWQYCFIQATPNPPFGAKYRMLWSQQYGGIHLSAARRHGYRDIAGTGSTRWDGIIILIILSGIIENNWE